MLDCMGAEAERQDKRLKTAEYKKLMNELKPERKRQLQEKPNDYGSSILRRTAISISIQTVGPQPG